MSEVLIRAYEPSDVDDIATIFQTPRCQRGTLRLPFESVEGTRERFAETPPGRRSLVAVDRETQRVVGIASMQQYEGRRSHAGGIGMCVHDDFQGRGIGTRLVQELVDLADRWLRIERLELSVYTDNVPAIRLYEKFGFVNEGTHRRFALRDGEYVDAHFMARVKE